jgi:hypothetical protein
MGCHHLETANDNKLLLIADCLDHMIILLRIFVYLLCTSNLVARFMYLLSVPRLHLAGSFY